MGSCRCKMCGGHIHYDDNLSIATCEFCGTEQTVFRSDDAKRLSLFNRANSLRLQNEFDKAQLTYDNILIDEPNNSEAHWGICLCRYGIEYIEANNKRVPICHRTAMKSIFDDLDYKESIENADVVAKKYYQEEAKVIDKIQKDILKISQKEEPYDIFISYKENDENSIRTKDSMMGEIIYNALTNKGYRVFYSKIALKNKDVSMYEPIIFAALRSARIMIPIGSKPEYFNSIWEKNEWSRFLSFMQDDDKKYMIPCFFDMDSFNMPDEFLVFEAVDLNETDYTETIINRIDKLLNKKTEKTVSEAVNHTYNSSINNMLERIKYCISEKDYKKASELIENTLNIDYKCAKAYYLKVFVNNNASTLDDFVNNKIAIEEDPDFKKALNFADEKYREQLMTISKNIQDSRILNALEEVYKVFVRRIIEDNFSDAFRLSRKITGYKDVNKKVEDLKEKCYQKAQEACKAHYYERAIELYSLLYSYKDSDEMVKFCRKMKIKDDNLAEAAKLSEIMDLIIGKYKSKELHDSDVEYYGSYATRYKTLTKEYDTYTDRINYYVGYMNTIANAKTIEIREENRRRNFIIIRNAIIIAIALALMLTIIITPIVSSRKKKQKRYREAVEFIDKGDYYSASRKLEGLKYKDSDILRQLLKAEDWLKNGNYEEAIDYVYNAGGTTNVSYDSKEGLATKTDEVIKKLYINNDPTATGREFVKWTINSYEIDFKEYILDLKLKAEYNKIEYSIFYGNLPTKEETYQTLPKIYTYEEIGTVSIPNAVWPGYTFLGWTTENDNEPKQNYSFNSNQTGDIYLNAHWKANEYIITVDTNGGEELVDNRVPVTSGKNYTLPVPAEREGYTFKGYGISYKRYTDNEGKSLSGYDLAQDVTFKAIWEGNPYKVTIKAGSKGYIRIPNNTERTTDDETIGLIPGSNSKGKTLGCGTTLTLVAEHIMSGFMGWYVDGEKVSSSSEYTFTIPAHDCTIETRYS